MPTYQELIDSKIISIYPLIGRYDKVLMTRTEHQTSVLVPELSHICVCTARDALYSIPDTIIDIRDEI